MRRFFRFVIEIPALDRLMDYLEAGQQQEVDDLTARLRASNERLKASIQKEKQQNGN
jgi:hypothetical protein